MLYINMDNGIRLFSDKHYRNEAIDDLQRFIDEGNSKYDKKFKLELFNDRAPYIIICEHDLSYCWNYGGGNTVGRDYDYQRWKAACREQKVESVESVEGAAQNVAQNVAQIVKNVARVTGIDLKKYIADACRTECEYSDAVLRASEYIDLLHGSIGLCTEIGELQDQVKRFVFYGKDLDIVNIAEEIGDLMWYCAIICKSLKLDWQKIFKKNIEKLKARYPEKFSGERALNRNLEAEREVLE